MKRRDQHSRTRALNLLEESVHVLRTAPATALLAYMVGTAPFILALLFYWSDMSRSAFAENHLVGGAIGIAVLFTWMKTWQAIFAGIVRTHVSREPLPHWTPARVWRVVTRQLVIQPSGLFLLPIALAIMLPFGWLFAFYQNVSVLGARGDESLRDFIKHSWREAKYDWMQNHTVISVLLFFTFIVLLNIGISVFLVPQMLKTLAGIDTPFTLSAASAFNTTFVAVIFGVTYLCVDPLVKTVYVLRCFYGESRQTGEDLRVALRKFAVAALTVAVLLAGIFSPAAARAIRLEGQSDRSSAVLTPSPLNGERAGVRGGIDRATSSFQVSWRHHPSASIPLPVEGRGKLHSIVPLLQPALVAAEEPRPAVRAANINPSDLNQSIDEVLRKPEYTWRTPRLKYVEPKEHEREWKLLRRIGKWFDDVFDSFGRFIKKLFGGRAPTAGPGFSLFSKEGLAYTLIVVVAIVIGLLLYFIWRIRIKPRAAAADAEVAAAPPDLADENISAEQLPEDGWLRLGLEMLERGDLRPALRAFYLASLAHLAERNLVTLAKFKSNRDYERELLRRSHALPDVAAMFSENVSTFDRVWYGLHEVTTDLLQEFRVNVERIKSC